MRRGPGGRGSSLPENDVAEAGRRRSVARQLVRGYAAGDRDHGDAGPEPPAAVDRAVGCPLGRMRGGRGRRRGWWPIEPEALGIARGPLRLEIADQLLDLRAVGRVLRERQVFAIAEDRRVVVAEVAIALADVEQEVGQRPGVERLLVLVDRLAEPGERVELLAALEVELGLAQGGILGPRDGCGDGGERDRDRDQETVQGHFLRNGSRVSAGSMVEGDGFAGAGSGAGGATAGGSGRSGWAGLIGRRAGRRAGLGGAGGLAAGGVAWRSTRKSRCAEVRSTGIAASRYPSRRTTNVR